MARMVSGSTSFDVCERLPGTGRAASLSRRARFSLFGLCALIRVVTLRTVVPMRLAGR